MTLPHLLGSPYTTWYHYACHIMGVCGCVWGVRTFLSCRYLEPVMGVSATLHVDSIDGGCIARGVFASAVGDLTHVLVTVSNHMTAPLSVDTVSVELVPCQGGYTCLPSGIGSMCCSCCACVPLPIPPCCFRLHPAHVCVRAVLFRRCAHRHCVSCAR